MKTFADSGRHLRLWLNQFKVLMRYKALKRSMLQWLKQPLEHILFSIIKITVAAFALLSLFSLAASIWSEDNDEIVILPFQTPSNQGYDGQALSYLLIQELIEINDTYEAGMDRSSNLHMQNYSIPHIKLQVHTLDYSLSNVGKLAMGPSILSIGDVYLSLKRLLPFAKTDTTLSPSLQVYDTKVVLVACLNTNTPKVYGWQIASEDNCSQKEIPDLVQELAYKTFHGIYAIKANSSRTWQAFANITEGVKAYQAYRVTGNESYLEKARNMSLKAQEHDKGVQRILQVADSGSSGVQLYRQE